MSFHQRDGGRGPGKSSPDQGDEDHGASDSLKGDQVSSHFTAVSAGSSAASSTATGAVTPGTTSSQSTSSSSISISSAAYYSITGAIVSGTTFSRSTSSPSVTVSASASSSAEAASPGNHIPSIVGIVVGSVAALAIVTLSICFFLRRRRRVRSSVRSDLITPWTDLGSVIEGTYRPISQIVINGEKSSRPAVRISPPHLPELPSFPRETTDVAVEAPPGLLSDHNVQDRLESLQRNVVRMAQHINQLESQRDHHSDSIMGRFDTPPPTYVSE
ncbi:hypothetical protein GYMLUDRAFT_263899 [Collybiopsis luxurians FD-317 M1]|uniref:Mid2 domain-containing protein n=1 Tax=Collybiopsis luxurians FD-317 M1 TaxID=944289 RepID=A0A0D0AZ31_9AGAR|nr:hypothetical protein GYMLUDRAFT_263899 [Collybiopsis luxurians FD-317 M1]